MQAMSRFEGKVVIVTGAASGTGNAIAHRFSKEGAIVVLVDRDAARVGKAAADMPRDRTLVLVVDVSQTDAADAMVATTVEKFGRLDVLVNNAGLHEAWAPEEITGEDWDKVMSVDADCVLLGCRAAIPHLERSRGSIVNTALASGARSDRNTRFREAIGGSVVNLTRALAMELFKRGVRVNAVCPSLTRAGMAAGAPQEEEPAAQPGQHRPLGQYEPQYEPREVAAVVAFLASEDASFMTGANVPVDGDAAVFGKQASLSVARREVSSGWRA